MRYNKSIKIIAIMFTLLLGLTACSREDSKSTSAKPQKPAQETLGNKKQLEETDSPREQDNVQTNPNAPVSILVFYSNDDATGFLNESISIDLLSPEQVLNVLISKGVIRPDAKVLDFKIESVDDLASIHLDMNKAFVDYNKGLGTTGEYYTIGSICNTFLSAYNCQQIKITAEGQTISTGHTEYVGYMTQFE